MQALIKKYGKYLPLLLFVISLTLTLPTFLAAGRHYRINHQFQSFTNTLFTSDVKSNALNLHYTLANPAECGITDSVTTLGTFSPEQAARNYVVYENRLISLSSFSRDQLTPENQLTYDILSLSYQTEMEGGNHLLLEEALSPMLGVQAQLPILLAEYTFRSVQDVEDYLKILGSVDSYFQSIMAQECWKSENGTFMSDTSADRIIEQCEAFLGNPDQHYLVTVFDEKIAGLKDLSQEETVQYKEQNRNILKQKVFPAYQMLIDGLSALKGTGKNEGGLYGYSGGRAYYEYLLKSTCGLYESVAEIQNRLLQQLQADMAECEAIFRNRPDLLEQFSSPQEEIVLDDPEAILADLQEKMQNDFPGIPKTSYTVKEVPEGLAEYLSPAFYLTPPIDTLSPNDIYINPADSLEGLELYTTLAHEGFPGHLYQTHYFALQQPSAIRHLLDMSGYVEGWATYVESLAYTYADVDPDYARLCWLNRSLNLCILCLMDTGIHYDGWDHTVCQQFLSGFGITDPSIQSEICQTIIETPANYLKYYMGYLHFQDLRTTASKEAGKSFSLKAFHAKVLSIGPCPFPILEKWLKLK